MATTGREPEAGGTRAAVFATTQWSVVLMAGDRALPQSAQALETLCRTYWYPLYAYVRRRGYGTDDAQDLIQEFFARFLARNYLGAVDRRRGRFRSYLLGALHHFLSDDWDRRHRVKRGGQVRHVPFEVACGEGQYAAEAAEEHSPDRLFERRWALALLDRVLRQLEQEYGAAGRERVFTRLRVFLTDAAEGDRYRQAALDLEMTQGAVRVAVHRLRRRYGELFHQAVADTVEKPEEIPDEMRHLLEVLSS